MRWTILAIASLLAACAPAGNNTAANGNGNGATDSAGQSGAPSAPAGESTPPPATNGNESDNRDQNGEQPIAAGEAILRAAPARVESGATVTLTLTNGTDERIGYNLCTSGLQTASGNEVRTGRICTMELRILGPGKSVDYAYELPPRLKNGSYRFTTNVERMDSGQHGTATSNSVEVR